MRLLAFALALLPVVPAAAQTTVGAGDPSALQAAIDAAAPGDTLLVSSFETFDAIVIDKPLVLQGQPTFRLGLSQASSFTVTPHVRVTESVAGTVVLSGLRIDAEPAGDTFLTGGEGWVDVVSPNADLVLNDCRIDPPFFFASGFLPGPPAVRSLGSFVFVQDCRLEGSGGDSGDTFSSELPAGGEGVRAPDAVVVAVDSELRAGADGFGKYFLSPQLPPEFGTGSPALVARKLFRSDLLLAGGEGGTWTPGVTEPDGPPAQLTEPAAAFGSEVSASGPWLESLPPLLWTELPEGTIAVVVIGTELAPPTDVPGLGIASLDPASVLRAVAVPVAEQGRLTLPLGSVPAASGTFLAAQVWHPQAGLTPPLVGVLRP